MCENASLRGPAPQSKSRAEGINALCPGFEERECRWSFFLEWYDRLVAYGCSKGATDSEAQSFVMILFEKTFSKKTRFSEMTQEERNHLVARLHVSAMHAAFSAYRHRGKLPKEIPISGWSEEKPLDEVIYDVLAVPPRVTELDALDRVDAQETMARIAVLFKLSGLTGKESLVSRWRITTGFKSRDIASRLHIEAADESRIWHKARKKLLACKETGQLPHGLEWVFKKISKGR